jgi:hypothetical protein
MGKKQLSSRLWTVHLESRYRPDRDERISRAYELALPIINTPTRKIQEEEKDHEITTPARGDLRSRFQ